MGSFGGVLRGVLRRIGDNKSYIVSIYKYFDISSWRPTFDEYMDRLNYVSWIELDRRTEVISNPLGKYARLDMLSERFRLERSLERDNGHSLYLQAFAGEHYELSFNSC